MFTRRSRSQIGVPCRPDFSVNMLTGSVGTDSFGRSTLESTQLSERCRPLRERVVLVDGLFGLGLHPHPRGVRHLRISLQQPVQDLAHDVLDELRVAMGHLDQATLIGPLEQSERRGDSDSSTMSTNSSASISWPGGSCKIAVVRLRWLCVIIGTPSGHRVSSGCSFMTSSRTVSIAHGQAVMPTTSTPIERSTSAAPRRAFARATSRYGSRDVRPEGEVRSRK